VLGLNWASHGRDLRQRLGIQLQETQLSEKLTVEETFRLFRSFHERGPTIDELLRTVDLESKRRSWVGKLSGGPEASARGGVRVGRQPRTAVPR
jgi:ABC-2 type transport system ATP-binding protein